MLIKVRPRGGGLGGLPYKKDGGVPCILKKNPRLSLEMFTAGAFALPCRVLSRKKKKWQLIIFYERTGTS